jgi:glycosyltransferase involved in cell wall biosynthesis
MHKMKSPKVSFIVIAFNEEKRIATTLSSIVAQESSIDFEVIVFNDGSKDNTAEVARNCLATFKRFNVIDKKVNVGRGSARLLGSLEAAGEFLAFIDSDVELSRTWLEETAASLESGADAVSGIAVPDGDCVVIGRISKLKPKVRPGSAKLTGNNLLIKKLVLESVTFQEIPYGDDIRLAWDLERKGFVTRRLDKLVVKHSEKKSYLKTLLWQYQQGKDATLLLIEYRKFRLPDSVWIFSFLLPAVALTLQSKFTYPNSLTFVMTLYIFVVSIVFISSRFIVNLFNWRSYFAVVVNLPFMASYLTGRYIGLIKYLIKSRVRLGK